MRRKEREITGFETMTAILERCDCCRLGLVDDGYSYIVPLNFGLSVDSGALTLYFHCAGEGKKTDLIRQNSVVTFEADSLHELVRGENACAFSFRYASVMGRGTVRIAATIEEKTAGLTALMAHYAPDFVPVFSEKQLRAVTVLVLEVSEWSCKANL